MNLIVFRAGNQVSLSNLSLSNYGKRRMHADGYINKIVTCALMSTVSLQLASTQDSIWSGYRPQR